MKNLKLLDAKITKGSQSTLFTYICQYGALKLRFSIKSDAYEENSYARVAVWAQDALSWNAVASIQPSDMETDTGLVYRPNWSDERHYEADYDRLQALAAIVLGDAA